MPCGVPNNAPQPARQEAPNAECIEARPEDGQAGRQQRQGAPTTARSEDDRASDAHRAQDHELEEHQPDQAEQHRQAAEEDRPTGRGHGGADGRLEQLAFRLHGAGPGRIRIAARSTGGNQLLAEAAREEQRVVAAQPEAEQRREVEHEDAHRRQRGSDDDGGQRDDHGHAAHDDGHASRNEAAEDHQQRQGRQRQGDHLAAAQVLLGHDLDVAVERGAAGDADRQLGLRMDCRLDRRDGRRRVVRREVQRDDLVDGRAVRADLSRRERCAEQTRRRALRAGRRQARGPRPPRTPDRRPSGRRCPG